MLRKRSFSVPLGKVDSDAAQERATDTHGLVAVEDLRPLAVAPGIDPKLEGRLASPALGPEGQLLGPALVGHERDLTSSAPEEVQAARSGPRETGR